MCQFFSGLVTKNKTYFNLDHDDHQRLIRDAGLRDEGRAPDFVRVELLPEDGDIFNHNIKNWKLKVDQDFRPDWFEEKWAEEMMKEEIKKVFKNRFVLKDLDKIENGRWFIGAGGTVQDVSDGGTVQDVRAGGTVQDVRAGGTVQDVSDGGTVQYVSDGGTVQYVRAGGTVQYVRAGGTVQDVSDGGTVQDVRAGGTVQDVRGICIFRSKDSKYEKITDNGIVILKNDKKILVANKDFKLVKVKQ